jgi:hypothetical protein
VSLVVILVAPITAVLIAALCAVELAIRRNGEGQGAMSPPWLDLRTAIADSVRSIQRRGAERRS